MIVDCTTCAVRGSGCDGCVVTVVFEAPPGPELPWHRTGRGQPARAGRADDDVDRALRVLAAAGVLADTAASADEMWARSVGLVPTGLHERRADRWAAG